MNKCRECGKICTKKLNVFCNRSCAAKYNNKKYPKIRRNVYCKNCGKRIEKKYNNIFCDIDCFNENKFKIYTLARFNNGVVRGSPTQRKALRLIHGKKCSKCSIGEVWNDDKLVLEVDHIDGNSDNNMPDNLRLLCPNCHSQEPTSKDNRPKNTKRNNYFKGRRNMDVAQR